MDLSDKERDSASSSSKEMYWIWTENEGSLAPPENQHWFYKLFSNFPESCNKAGLNLIIVDRNRNQHNALLVDEWHGSGISRRLKRRYKSAPSTREPLISPKALITNADKATMAKTHLLVFECTYHCGIMFADLELQPLHLTKLRGDFFETPRILFNRTYTPSSGCRTLDIMLHIQAERSEGLQHQDLVRTGSIYLFIASIHQSRSTTPSLTAQIISHIAEYALVNCLPLGSEWNDTILSLGLVNRSWIPIFDIRWRHLGSGNDHVFAFSQFKSAALSLKKGLSVRASRYIKGFNLRRFRRHPSTQAQLFGFACTLINYSCRLSRLRINGDIFVMAADSLAKQQSVLAFEIMLSKHDNTVAFLGEVCSVIHSWTQLRALVFSADSEATLSAEQHPRINQSVVKHTMSYHLLEELFISEVDFSQSQLLRVLPTTARRFRKLFAWRAIGLSTHDLSTFFSLTHSTLVEFQITDSTICPTHPEHSENTPEYPLDAWIGEMKCLSRVNVPGSIASLLSVMRKPKSFSICLPDGTEQRSSINIVYNNPSNMVPSAEGLNPQNSSEASEFLVSAIDQSGWDEVSIVVPFNAPLPIMAWKKALSVAKEKGMKLALIGPHII